MGYYKTYLNIDYSEKDKAKECGAKWDKEKKKWYMPHFDSWTEYEKINYYTNISQNSFDSLLQVNNIAKLCNKDIFEIIPEYSKYEKSLSNILTKYATQMSGIENSSDVLYHPETYFDDLLKQYNFYKEQSETYTDTNKNHESFMKNKYSIIANNYKNILDFYDITYDNQKEENDLNEYYDR